MRDGWAQITSYAYRAEEGRTAYARAYREGGDWTVVLYDMDDAIAEKRDSQIEVALGRLLPQGYRRESFAGRQAHRLDATRVQALTDLIETARADLDIPGVALGLVQDGEVVFQGGFGVREIGRSETVDADTAFMIGSNGKALTTLLLARLVERGLLDWDAPVSSVWPAFRLGDAVTTRQVRVRHLVCACTGLPRQDYPWIFQGDEAQAATVLDWLSEMKPTSDFGELYQYSNLMAAAGGYLAAHILHPEMEFGAAYDLAMQDEVFDPLGMTETTFNQARVMADDHASPHALDIDGVQRIAVMGLNDAGVPSRPDGGEWSTVRDMLHYVQMELAQGRLPDGTALYRRRAASGASHSPSGGRQRRILRHGPEDRRNLGCARRSSRRNPVRISGGHDLAAGPERGRGHLDQFRFRGGVAGGVPSSPSGGAFRRRTARRGGP